MAGKFNFKLYMIEVDPDRVKELRVVLGRMIRGAGKAKLVSMIKRTLAGEPVLVYQTNDAFDAKDKADVFARGGARIKIDGL